MKIKETLIITDPCYFMRAKHHGTTPTFEDDWDHCNYGEDLHKLGFKNYISVPTGVGDWVCEVLDTDTNEPIGEFCADSGMVCVVPLKEVLEYNPDFNYHDLNPWTNTVIKDFDGHVDIVDTNKQWVQVVGQGNVNFKSIFTGF